MKICPTVLKNAKVAKVGWKFSQILIKLYENWQGDKFVFLFFKFFVLDTLTDSSRECVVEIGTNEQNFQTSRIQSLHSV